MGLSCHAVEHAPLRPVPSRPAGPIDPATAVREVTAALPSLPPDQVRALAFVALAERPRAQVALALGVGDEELAARLAAARKELRRSVAVLGGSGWCERAEGLISDRLDGVLVSPGSRHLDVHLRNCPRCVEHERRLVQATDALLARAAGAAERAAAPQAAEPAEPAASDTGPEEGERDGAVKDVGPEAGGPREDAAPPVEAAPPEDAAPPVLKAAPTEDTAPPEDATPADEAGPPHEAPSPVEAASREEVTPPHEADLAEEVAPEEDAPAAVVTPAPAPSEAQIAAAAEVLVTVRTRRQLAAAVTWNALAAIAILLALATIALTIAGILGAEL